MPNPYRESSHQLSTEEMSSSLKLAENIENTLEKEIIKVKEQFPDFFTDIGEKAQMLSMDIAQMIAELKTALKIEFPQPLSVEFARLQRGTKAFVEHNENQESRLVISLDFLEVIAQETTKGNGFEANAELRYVIAHEFFHLYAKTRYPTVMIRSAETSRIVRVDRNPYDLDLGERSADLFAIKHLSDQPAESEEQKQANEKIAKLKAAELEQKLQLIRLKTKLKKLFSF